MIRFSTKVRYIDVYVKQFKRRIEKDACNVHRYLSGVPHVAGTVHDRLQAEWVRDQFISYGLQAKVISYEVLLSYPDAAVPNTVSLVDQNGVANFTTVGRQPPLAAPEESSSEVLFNFNAYAANGSVEVWLTFTSKDRLH